MAQQKIITVFGATGAQGGGLVKAILNDPDQEFAVRAVTRNPGGEKAQKLRSQGVEVVGADVSDLDAVAQAMEGAYGAFCVTFFWEHMSVDAELKEAKNMADAAAKAGVQHVVWSTLEDTRNDVPLDDDRIPTLHGKYKVPHFDGKGEADSFFAIASVPTTYLLASFYWDNLINFGMGPRRGEDGKLMLAFPMPGKKLAGIAADDIGPCALGIFKHPEKYLGQRIGIAGEHLTPEEMTEKISNAIGEPVSFVPLDYDTYRGLGFPGADDLGNMFQYYDLYEKEFAEMRNVERAKELHPGLKSFDEWLAKNGEKLKA